MFFLCFFFLDNFRFTGTESQIGVCTAVAGSWSHTQVVCTTPPGMGLAWVVMRVTDYATPTYFAWSYQYPVLLSFEPTTATTWATNANVLVTITGESFAAAVGSVDFARNVSSINVNTNCAIQTWTHTKIICKLPDGEGANVYAQVSTQNGFISSLSTFSYLPPVLTTITPQNGPTTGSAITIAGSNFGTVNTPFTVSVALGNLTCAVQSHSHVQIICLTPVFYSRGHVVQVTVAGQVSNTLVYNYAAPTLLTISPDNGPSGGGQTVTLTGTYFTTVATVTIDGKDCTSVAVNAGQTSLTCITPVGGGTNRLVQARKNKTKS